MYGAILLGGLTAFVVAGIWLSEDPDSTAATALAVGAFLGTPVLALLVMRFRPEALEGRRDAADEPTEWLSPSELRQRLTREWRPETEHQRAAAAALARRFRGALVRHRPNGTTELLTGSKGNFTRYVLEVDGTATVVETIPSDGSYRSAGRLAIAGAALFVAGLVLASRDSGWDAREFVGGLIAFVGFVAAFIGLAAMGGEDGEHGALLHTQPGERWTALGYPSD